MFAGRPSPFAGVHELTVKLLVTLGLFDRIEEFSWFDEVVLVWLGLGGGKWGRSCVDMVTTALMKVCVD